MSGGKAGADRAAGAGVGTGSRGAASRTARSVDVRGEAQPERSSPSSAPPPAAPSLPTALVVLAKACRPGRVKTRLHPPLSLDDAALVAAASLDDTLAALSWARFDRRILCFDGVPAEAPAAAAGFELVPQAAGGLDDRIGAVLDLCGSRGERVVLVGMDTPQLDPALLDGLARARSWPVDAWLGPAEDGGFWLLALARADGDLVRGVEMSRDDTGERQLARLRAAGLRVGLLPTLRDIDGIADLAHVAGLIPGSATARAFARTRVPAGAGAEAAGADDAPDGAGAGAASIAGDRRAAGRDDRRSRDDRARSHAGSPSWAR